MMYIIYIYTTIEVKSRRNTSSPSSPLISLAPGSRGGTTSPWATRKRMICASSSTISPDTRKSPALASGGPSAKFKSFYSIEKYKYIYDIYIIYTFKYCILCVYRSPMHMYSCISRIIRKVDVRVYNIN